MVQKLIEDVSFMAHGYCLLWDPRLLFLHAASDLVIALCYFAIPLGIWYYLRKRPDLELKGLAWLFVAFIFLCGMTHVIALITLWNPIYVTQGGVKFLTAGASLLTAASLVKIMPKALDIPSPAQLQTVNQDLISEIEAHRATLKELSRAKATLEQRVATRTKELEDATAQFQQLFKQSPAAMFMVDGAGNIEKSNTAATELFEIQDDDAEDLNIETLLPQMTIEHDGGIDLARDGSENNLVPAVGPTLKAKKANGIEFPTEVRTNAMFIKGEEHRIVSVFDVSERERRQRKIELLMAEVNHRANNLLAVVQTIARQTARESSAEDFSNTLSQRLQSLSTSQDLIIRGNWTKVDLGSLINRQLAFLGEMQSKRCETKGPQLKLTPQAAQGIGMAVHELATNSIKYGALSNDTGVVQIGWHFRETDGQRFFEIEWKESNGPVVVKPKRRGFGNTVIEKMAAAAVNGVVKLRYNPEGIVWRLTAPSEQSMVK